MRDDGACLRDVDIVQKGVCEDDVEAVGGGRVRGEGLEGVDACRDLVVPILIDGQSGYRRERQVEGVDGELLATVKYKPRRQHYT